MLRWYLEQVEREIESSRAWRRLRPGIVAPVEELRNEYGGGIDDERPRSGGS